MLYIRLQRYLAYGQAGLHLMLEQLHIQDSIKAETSDLKTDDARVDLKSVGRSLKRRIAERRGEKA